MNLEIADLRRLSDDVLIARVKQCVATERRATAQLIAVLAEFDIRRLCLGLGFSSLFDYCTRHLHFSERAACSRIAAARLSRRFPLILELIEDSQVSLTAISLLSKHLNESNYRVLLEEAKHKTASQVEVIVARLAPKPDARAMVRRLPAEAVEASTTRLRPANIGPSKVALSAPATSLAASALPAAAQEPSQGHSLQCVSAPPAVKPLSPERYKIQFTISEVTREKLLAVQSLLRHSIPRGDLEQIFDRALAALLADLEKKKLAIVAKPREPRRNSSSSNTRLIPAAVRRAVWRRDRARCAFVGPEGRCRERGGLELHHVKPFAAGGKAIVENIQLRCRAHNSYEAQLFFEVPQAT